MQQFWYIIAKKPNSSSYQFMLDNQKCEVGVELFREILRICPRVPNKKFVEPPSHNELVTFLKQLGYTGSLELISELYVDHMYQPWRTFLTIINNCLSDYAELIWEDIQFQINNRQSSAKRKEQMPYPRFTKLVINHFLTKYKSIPRRHTSFNNTIKYDGVLGKLKFFNKGKDEQITSLPKAGKGKSKGSKGKKKSDPHAPKEHKKKATPKTKGRITANDNILSNLNESLKLGESMSLTKA
ncbi:hypothetical protein Tco_0489366 [Tanacetum coccineum]